MTVGPDCDSEVDLHRLELRFAAMRVNDERAVQRLMQSIQAHEQRIGCIVVAEPVAPDWPGPAPLVLIDGYRRVAALRKLGRDTVLVQRWSGPVDRALAQVLAQSRSRAFTALEEALLLRALMNAQSLSQRQAAQLCARDVSWVQRRLQLLSEVPETVLEAVRSAQVSTWSAVRVFVPLARANSDHAQRLLASVARAQPALSTRELIRWFAHYGRVQRKQREHMVDHPRLFIDSSNERERERAAEQLNGGPEQRAIGQLGQLQTQLERTGKSLGALQAPAGLSLARACRRVQAALAPLQDELRRLGHEVDPNHQQRADPTRSGPFAAPHQPTAAPIA